MLLLEKRTDESNSFFYSDFKKFFQRLANEIERSVPLAMGQEQRVRDLSITGRHQVNVLAE